MIHKVFTWRQTPYHFEMESSSGIQAVIIILNGSQTNNKVGEMQSFPDNWEHQKHNKANEKQKKANPKT